MENTIKVGDYLIVQRQNYTKLHKIKTHGNLALGNFTVEMDNVVGEKYFDTFQMKNVPGNKKFYLLEKVNEINSATTGVNIEKSGTDNRNIVTDGQSQTLTKDDIDKLKDSELNSNTIVEQLISNSKTFNMKTEFSQEKYIKKKEKKYFEYIQIRKPTVRLLAQMFYRQDPSKTLGIRTDDLSQILTYANIHSDGNHLLYDSGTSGLMPAAILNMLGSKTPGVLIHMHPGNECQRNAFVALQFPTEQAERCINVNLYSVLRCFYQSKEGCDNKTTEKEEVEEEHAEPPAKKFKTNIEECSRSSEEETDKDSAEPPVKNPKTTEEDSVRSPMEVVNTNEKDNADSPEKNMKKIEEKHQKRPQWKLDNDRACGILKNKVDSLIITAKEHPVNLIKELLQFLKGGRTLVVFSLLREPLQDLYLFLKARSDVISIKLTSNFLRYYQVLPERTHPEVNMNTGGFILTAHKLIC